MPLCLNSQFHHDVTIFLITEQGGASTILIKTRPLSSPQSLAAGELGELEINHLCLHLVGSGTSEYEAVETPESGAG